MGKTLKNRKYKKGGSPSSKSSSRKNSTTSSLVLKDEYVTFFINQYEDTYGEKLTPQQKEGLGKTLRKIRIMPSSTFKKTRQFYDDDSHKKKKDRRSPEDELYHQVSVRIDNHFKDGDYHDYKFDGTYDKNGNL
jgi:hypothetical protein